MVLTGFQYGFNMVSTWDVDGRPHQTSDRATARPGGRGWAGRAGQRVGRRRAGRGWVLFGHVDFRFVWGCVFSPFLLPFCFLVCFSFSGCFLFKPQYNFLKPYETGNNMLNHTITC